MSNWQVQIDNWLFKWAKKLFGIDPWMVKKFHWYGMNLGDLLEPGLHPVYGQYVDEIGIELDTKQSKHWVFDAFPSYPYPDVILEQIGVCEYGRPYAHFVDKFDNWWEIE